MKHRLVASIIHSDDLYTVAELFEEWKDAR